jgi:hypothetical protein
MKWFLKAVQKTMGSVMKKVILLVLFAVLFSLPQKTFAPMNGGERRAFPTHNTFPDLDIGAGGGSPVPFHQRWATASGVRSDGEKAWPETMLISPFPAST